MLLVGVFLIVPMGKVAFPAPAIAFDWAYAGRGQN
jgi:hypothetical protein